jgi:hypothetical protein
MLRDLHFPGSKLKSDTQVTDPGIRIADANIKQLFPEGLVYSSPARGTWTIAHTSMLIPGSHQIFVCPSCCLRGVVLSAEEMGAMERFSMLEFTDEHILKGDLESMIIEGVTEILHEMEKKPTCVLLYTSCVQHFLNIDLSLVYRESAARFPDIDFIDCYMLPTMRKHFTPEKMQWRQLYRAVQPLPVNEKAVNFIGSYYAIDADCELYDLLGVREDMETAGADRDSGKAASIAAPLNVASRKAASIAAPLNTALGKDCFIVRQLPTLERYEEYKYMGEALANIYFNPVIKFAADDMEKRLGQKGIYLPALYDFREIERCERLLTEELGRPIPDDARAWFDTLRYEAEDALLKAKMAVGIREIAIDGAAVTRPLSLAKMLFKQGFRVTRVYADAFLPEETEDFRWLAIHAPEIRIYPMTDSRMRRADRKPEGPGFVAIGQKATYFTGTRHFVNLVENGGLYGFRGIRRLARFIALRTFKDSTRLCCGSKVARKEVPTHQNVGTSFML